MSIILTAIFRVTNWQALRRLSDQSLVVVARAAGATRYRLCRNAHDAAEALLIAEFESHDTVSQLISALGQINQALARPTSRPCGALADDRVWEPTMCLMIGEER
jgi:hypothetical protein